MSTCLDVKERKGDNEVKVFWKNISSIEEKVIYVYRTIFTSNHETESMQKLCTLSCGVGRGTSRDYQW